MMRTAMNQVRSVPPSRDGPGGDGPLVRAPSPSHVRGDRREDEDALEPLAEDQDRDIEDARPEIPTLQGVGKSSRAEDLQDEDGGHGGDADGQNPRHDARLHVIKIRCMSGLTISDRIGRR